MLVQQMASAGAGGGAGSGSPGGNPWPLAMAVLTAQLNRFVWLIVAATLIFGIGAVFARILLPKSYQATVQVLIDPHRFRVFSNDLQTDQLDANASINFVESQMGVIRSERVLLRVLREQRAIDAGTKPAPDSSATSELGELDESRALAKLQRAVSVQRLERSFIVDVTVADASASRAASLANAIVKAYIDEDTIDRNGSVKRLTGELTSRLEGLRQSLRDSEGKVEAFRAKNGLAGVNDKLVIEQRLAEATTALSMAETREAQVRGRLSQLTAGSNQMSAISALGTDPESRRLALLLEVQASARNDLEQLTGSLGEQHPSLVSARNRVNEIEKSINAAVGNIRKGAQSQLDQVQTEVSYLSRKVTALSADLAKAREAEVGLRMLQADADAHRKILESFENRSREAGEFGQIDSNNLRIISPARTPNEQGQIKGLLLWGILGSLMGATFSMGVIGFAAMFTQGNRDPDQAQHTPVATPAPEPRTLAPRSTDSQRAFPADAPRPIFPQPNSPFSAAVKALYKSCLGAGKIGFRKKKSVSVLVTSAGVPGDHARVSANLASIAAANGHRVLLVDSNPASPSLSSAVPPGAPVGLIMLAGVLRPIYRLDAAYHALSVVPIMENERDVCLRLVMRREQSEKSEVSADFNFIVYNGPLLSDRKQVAGLARAADRIVLVSAGNNPAEPNLNEVASRLDVPANRILWTADKAIETNQAA
jgi:succinoglycan biosynthesis transport protein ExoP